MVFLMFLVAHPTHMPLVRSIKCKPVFLSLLSGRTKWVKLKIICDKKNTIKYFIFQAYY